MPAETYLLTELDAQFLVIKSQGEEGNILSPVETLAEAQGVRFLCPVCFKQNNGPVGTHGVICWFNARGVDGEMTPGPGRWNPSGQGLQDLTFVPPGATSVLLLGGCNWHGFVVDGRVTLTP